MSGPCGSAPGARDEPGGTGSGAAVRVAASPGSAARADALAARWGLSRGSADYELWCGAGGPVLRRSGGGGPEVRAALDAERPGRDPLVRAVIGRRGSAASTGPVADATAGLGGDAGALAAAGLRVHMFERAPFLAALLDEALAEMRASADPRRAERATRLTLHGGDAVDGLGALVPAPEVVLLDPMYPRGKAAAKAAGIELLRALLGPSDERETRDLLRVAREVARRLVVVKRPRAAPALEPGASGSVHGRTTRFDLYAGRGGRATRSG